AGLGDDGPALRRAGDVQRSADLEMRPLVVEAVQLRGVVVDAARPVAQQRPILETVPKAEGDVDELPGAGVTLRMRVETAAVEVVAGLVMVRGHDVPGGSATAEMIDGGEDAGQIV